jgi:PAS domain S-box-containing protein
LFIAFDGTIGYDLNGCFKQTHCILQDITENKLAEKALKESEEKYRLLYENAGLGIGYWDVDGTIISFNKIAAKNMNGKPEDFTGKSLYVLFPKSLAEFYHERIKKAMVSEVPAFYEDEVSLPTGNKYFLSTYSRIANSNNEIYGIQILSHDITDRKRAEESLQKSEENLSITLNSIGDGVISIDINGLIANMNPVAEKLCGWKLSDAKGKPLTEVFQIINAETRQSVADPVEKVLENGEIAGLANHTVLVSKDGNEYQISDSAAPIKNKFGTITGVVLVFSDATEDYALRKSVEENERRYRSLFHSTNDGVCLHEVIYKNNEPADYKIIDINRRFEEIAGISRVKAISALASELYGTNPPPYLDVYAKVAETGTPAAFETYFAPMKKHFYISAYSPERGKFATVFQDITKRKLAEEALHESEERFKALHNASFGGIAVHDKGKILECNQGLSEMMGYSRDELFSMDGFLLIAPESRELVMNNVAAGVEKPYEALGMRKNGQIFPMILEARSIPYKGKTVRTVEFRDITDRKKSELALQEKQEEIEAQNEELQQLNEELSQTNKELIEARNKAEESDRLKSAFLANMSHEIRTPMNGILGFADLLKEPNLTGAEQQKYIAIIEKSGNRMLNIINDIIDISKIEAGVMKPDIKESNINEQIEYIYTFFKPEVEAKGLKFSFKTPLPAKEAILHTDREKVYAILTNLVKNAIKYTHQGEIEFGYGPVETLHATSLQFFITDTGIGIPPDRQEAIFERFIQADISDKMARQGAGLGLAITKSFVEMLGGKIWVESQEGVGSTFYFTLPYTFGNEDKTIAKTPVVSEEMINSIKPLKILIAEDDETSEMLIAMMVDVFGKEILTVETGTQAVETCRNNSDIDLVLMDIRMPGMGGYEATRQIREFNREVVIIAQTAYGLSGDREKALEAGCNDYISKPIKKEELLRLIQKYFGKQSSDKY